MLAYDRAYGKRIARRRRADLDAIKIARGGCVDCGTVDARLEFDHRPGEAKLFEISQGLGRSWEATLLEIEKCDVRCASCHAKRHWATRKARNRAAAERA